MNRWPSWRFEQGLDEAEQVEVHKRIEKAKAEAQEALAVSQAQVAHVHRITAEHKPIRDSLRKLREKNSFAEGFKRVIEEGR